MGKRKAKADTERLSLSRAGKRMSDAGASKGGTARASKLSAGERSAIARKGGQARSR